MRVASLDLGSNSFLMCVAEVDKGSVQKWLLDEVEIVRLGEKVQKTKQLQPEALERAEACLKKFSEKLQQAQCHRIQAVTTAAVRLAENKQEFLSLLERFKIPCEIVSGEREAELTYQGVQGSSEFQGPVVLIDIGGASTEVIVGHGSKILFRQSVSWGAVSLTEKWQLSLPIRQQLKTQVQGFIQTEFMNVLKQAKTHLDLRDPFTLLAVAGTPTELAKSWVKEFDPQKIDGFHIQSSMLAQRLEDFARSESSQELSRAFHIDPKRADVIWSGAQILFSVQSAFGGSTIQVSTKGIRHGVIYEMAQI